MLDFIFVLEDFRVYVNISVDVGKLRIRICRLKITFGYDFDL